MNSIKNLDAAPRKHYASLERDQLVVLALTFKTISVLFFGVIVCLFFGMGWKDSQCELAEQQHEHLAESANNALWEIENGSAIEAANRLREGL